MTKHASKVLIFLVVVAVSFLVGFYVGRITFVKGQQELQEKITAPVTVNPLENLPAANPFEAAEVNPFNDGYQNPFGE